MNNKFKRALSSILAFIMLCSCAVTMNVSSVFAASATITDTTVLTGNAPLTDTTGVIVTPNKDDSGNIVSITYKYTIPGVTSSDILTGLTLTGMTVNSSSDKTFTGKFESAGTIKFQTDGIFDVKITNDNARLDGVTFKKGSSSTSSDDKFDSNAGSSTYTAQRKSLEAGTYYFARCTSNANIHQLEITVYPKNGTEYSITGSCSGLSADDTFTLTDSSSNTYSAIVNAEGDGYTVTKTEETSPFAAGDTLTASKSGYKLANATVTLAANGDTSFTASPELAFEADRYTVSGTIYDSANPTTALTNAKVAATSGTVTTKGDGTFTVSDIIGNTTLTVSADDYTTKTLSYSDEKSNEVVYLVSKTIDDNTSTLTASKIYTAYTASKNDNNTYTYTATQADNISSMTGYTVNGFTLSGVKLQMTDDSGKFSGKIDDSYNYIARFNVGTSANIKYTPTVNGTLKIVTVSTNDNRGIYVKANSSDVVDKDLVKSEVTEVETPVDANTEYTITAKNNAINIYEITFTPSAIEIDSTVNNENNTTGAKVAYVKADGSYYAVVAIEAASEEAVKNIKNVVLSVRGNTIATIEEVYESVQFSDSGKAYKVSDFFNGLTGYVYGFKIDGTDNNTTDDAVKAGIGKIVATVNTNSTDAE